MQEVAYARVLRAMRQIDPRVGDWLATNRGRLISKRLIDLTLGTILAAAALPVILLLALGVALTLRDWPFFVHRRVGRHGRLFICPKLRTLPRTTPAYASKYDIDVTRDGFPGWLRRTHLDELPQLLVVPLGWLSLVGPRPEMPEVFESVPEEFEVHRLFVPQGCSGLWQVGLHTSALLHENPEYDLFYLEHASLRLDFWILWRSVLLLTGLGDPVGLDDVPVWARRDSMAPPVSLAFEASEAEAS